MSYDTDQLNRSSKSKHLPNFAVEAKAEARLTIVDSHRYVSGRKSIEGTYWTLCYKQFLDAKDKKKHDPALLEINQLTRLGFLTKSQFVGIDNERFGKVIARNRKLHPEAYWFKGEFVDVIEEQADLFESAEVIY